MQGHSSTNLESGTEQRSAQDTYVGRHVAFKASDLTDNDVEELKQQGLTLMARDEDGDTVFVLRDDSRTATDEEMTGEANTDSEDGEDEDGEDEDDDEEASEAEEDEGEEGDEPGKDYKGRTIPKDDEFREYCVLGTFTCGRDLKIDCALDVMTACDRKDPEVVKHYMKLEYLQLQLPNYIDKPEEKGHFVYRIEISAKPTEEWRPEINRMMVEPSNDSHPNILTLQQSIIKGAGLSITSSGVAGTQASYSTSKALSRSEVEFGWSCAEVNDSPDENHGNLPSWSVKWTWNLKYWKGGHQEFDQEKPSKFSTHFKISKAWEYFSNSLPELPYFSNQSVQPKINLTNVQENRAEWRSRSSAEITEGGVKNMEWDVEVELFTAKLRKREWSLKNGLKTSYEAEVLGPRQMKKISARVSVRGPLQRL